MKNLLAFAATFALGVAALPLAPGLSSLPPASAVPAPIPVYSSTGYAPQPAQVTIRWKPKYVFVSASDAPVRLPKTYSEVQRAEFESKTIAR